MKKLWMVFGVLSALVPATARAQCKDRIQALSAAQIGFSFCTATPEVADTMVIEAGGSQIVTEISTAGPFFQQHVGEAAVADPEKAQEAMLLLVGIDTATVKLHRLIHVEASGDQPAHDEERLEDPFDVEVVQTVATRNYRRFDWSVGPATEGDDEAGESTLAAAGESTDSDATGNPAALRFQFNGEYAAGGVFGAMKKARAENPPTPGEERASRWQTTASLAIDTTDQSSADFIDNNQATVGVSLTNLSLGRLWMHGTAGLEGSVEQAFHSDIRNVDALVTVSGWVPPLRSLTLFSQSDFIAAPLKLKASYGYRSHDSEDQSADGRVFTANATYNLFLFDNYQVSFDATLTHNDLDDRPANLPSTQRLYKATIAYLQPDSTFKVLTSIEDGSAGVMLREVRQYFVGIALSKLSLAGSGGG